MRIARVDLKAYGHFTNHPPIELPESPDLHIVYGPNEAGKTTISRALRAALFGFPKTTADSFVHQYPDLRVGIVLESKHGSIAAMRRKANKNSLIRYDPVTCEESGTAIADDVLPRLMGGLTEGLYMSMFSLDHDELVAGGKALSEGEGEVGQSLFAAGAGLTSIRRLREELTIEADGLFRPRASTSAFFQSLHAYDAAKTAAKDAQIRPAVWETLRKAKDDAREEYEKAKSDQVRLQQESRRLERLAVVLPDVASRTSVRDQLGTLAEAPRLDANAGERRVKSEALLEQAQDDLAAAVADITALQDELDAVPRAPAFLVEAAAIEAIYHSLAAYRAARDVAAAAASRIQLTSKQAEDLAAAIGETLRDGLRSIIPSATQRAKVLGLERESHLIKGALQQAVETQKLARDELRQIADELKGLSARVVPPSLKAAIYAYDTDGNPETKAAELAREVETTLSTLARSAKAFSDIELNALVAMKMPLATELQSFKDARGELQSAGAICISNIKKIESDMAVVEGQIQGIMQRGEVPTADHLGEQRRIRDDMWQKIRHWAYAEGPVTDEARPVPAEYERAVLAADSTADSRFADAARVSQHSDLVKRSVEMQQARDLERQQLAEKDMKAKEVDRQWQTFLATYNLPSMNVETLIEWMAKRQGIVDRYQLYVESEAKATAARAAVGLARTNISAALVEAGLPPCGGAEPIIQAIARAREYANQAGEAAAKAELLVRQKAQAEARFADAEGKIGEGTQTQSSWKGKWAQAMASIRLSGEALETEALARLTELEELENALNILQAARVELEMAQNTKARVEDEAKRLCNAAGYDAGQRPVDAIVAGLYDGLTHARKQEDLVRTLTEKIRAAEKGKVQAEHSIESANTTMLSLMAAAGCDNLQDLVVAEARSAERNRLVDQLGAIEERLVKASALSLPELLSQAHGQDIVQVRATLDRVDADLKVTNNLVEVLHESFLDAQGKLDKVDGASKASIAEQEAAEAAAQMATRIADFTAVTVASTILLDVIETYQQRHQGPLLARASELFSSITGGRFAKVITDFDEERTVLVGVTNDDKRKRVDALSSGRRDQLFLALRLAAIESHVANHGPIPVIVDDIVVNFDDAAASATFRVLAELATKTQVLFFTHHEHLLERAERAIGAGRFRAHVL